VIGVSEAGGGERRRVHQRNADLDAVFDNPPIKDPQKATSRA
jgi:hypothetical protein